MMKSIYKYIGILTLLPLFTIFFVTGSMGDAHAATAEGSPGHVPPKSYGSATAKIVCGDKLCSELEDEKENATYNLGIQ